MTFESLQTAFLRIKYNAKILKVLDRADDSLHGYIVVPWENVSLVQNALNRRGLVGYEVTPDVEFCKDANDLPDDWYGSDY